MFLLPVGRPLFLASSLVSAVSFVYLFFLFRIWVSLVDDDDDVALSVDVVVKPDVDGRMLYDLNVVNVDD